MNIKTVTPIYLCSSLLRVLIPSLAAVTTFAAAPAPATVPASAAATASVKVNEPADNPTRRLRNGATDNGWIGIHNRLLTTAKAGNIDLYFEGDSITDYWGRNTSAQPYKANFDKHFADWNAADFGVAADRTEHVLWRITNGELDGIKPKVIVLLIGTNNLPKDQGVYAPKTPAEDAAGVKAILDVMQQKQPQSKILLISVFPREDKINASNPDYKEDLNPKIKELNALLAKFDDGRQVKFLDIYDKLLGPDGHLLPVLSPTAFTPRKKATTSGPKRWIPSSPNGSAHALLLPPRPHPLRPSDTPASQSCGKRLPVRVQPPRSCFSCPEMTSQAII